jgi:hypothetical protein
VRLPLYLRQLLFTALFGTLLSGCGPHRTHPVSPSSPIRFRDVTPTAGLRFTRINGAVGKKWLPETMGGGGGFLDYDNDGWPDIVLVNGDYLPGTAPPQAGTPTLALYHNNHDGTFTDVTREAGLELRCNGMGVAVGDYDNDGYDDLFITAMGRSRLFHNVPDGHGSRKFVEVTAASGIRDEGWPTSAAWVDYDHDGRLDLFVCHYLQWSPSTDVYCGTTFKAYCGPQLYRGESCRLYHNDGNGRFTDVTRRAGVYNPNSKALGVCVCDLDGDGWPDLIVANDTEPNFVYRNNRHGGFEEIGVQTGIALSSQATGRAGMGIDASDYRHNGTLGLVIGNFSQEGLAFYDIPPSSATILATERSRQVGVYAPSYPYLTFGLFFADFDNDGWPDLFATNGHIETDIARIRPAERFAQPNLLFRNDGVGRFTDVGASAGAGVTEPLVGRGACRGDFDNDGRMDILVLPNTGPPRLLHNETPPQNHWITLRLIGTQSNRDAYGAKVTIQSGATVQSGYVSGGASYLSAHDPRLHFGLGHATGVERVTVHWPNGTTETWGPLAADRMVTLTERRSPQMDVFVPKQ